MVEHPVIVANPGEVISTSDDDKLLGTATFDATFPLVSSDKSGPIRRGLGIGEVLDPEDEFYGRPILITTINWAAASTHSSFKPFKLWINNPMVQARMQGATNVRFDLVLRFEFSPSFYHYGLARIAAFPLYDSVAVMATNVVEQINYAKASQMHGVWLDAAQPGTRELVIPWCHFVDAADITVDSGVFDEICDVFFCPTTGLKKSDGGTVGTIRILVRAYAINMVRAGPTRVAVDTQSSVIETVNSVKKATNGAVSSSLNFTSKAFGALSKIPAVAPYAKVAEAITAGLSTAADYLGWSRKIVQNRMIVRNHGFAGLDADDDALSLAYMDNYGVFGSVNGLSNVVEDEMSFKYIAGHESLIDLFNMSLADAYDTLLSTLQVHPMVCVKITNTTYASYTPCSVGWVAGPFAYWRGTLIYSFRVVCSNQHSGSIKIVYDPGSDAPDAARPFEMARTCVLEIKPGATAEVEVGWSSNRAWMPRKENYNSVPDDLVAAGYYNGVLRMYVHTPLVCPTTTSEVTIVVSVKGGEDFAVFENRAFPAVTTYQLEELELGGEAVELQAAVLNNISAVGKCRFGGPVEHIDKVVPHTMGEHVDSVRALLRRYCNLGVCETDTAGFVGYDSKTYFIASFLHETMLGGATSIGNGGSTRIVLNSQSNFRWFKCLYYGHRGGSRMRFRQQPEYLPGVWGWTRYQMAIGYDVSGIATTGGNACATVDNVLSSEVVDEQKREYADFRVPDHTLYRFTPGGYYEPGNGSGFARFRIGFSRNCIDANYNDYYATKAIDHDFSFIGFIGAPVCVK